MVSINVLPKQPPSNSRDWIDRNAEARCDYVLAHPLSEKLFYFSHLVLVKFCKPILAASAYYISTFLFLVGIVVGAGSKKQMVGVYARRVIAAMKDAEAVGDTAISEFVRKAMGFGDWFSRLEAKIAIAVGIGGAGPSPASVGFFNLAPEANFGRGCWVRAHA